MIVLTLCFFREYFGLHLILIRHYLVLLYFPLSILLNFIQSIGVVFFVKICLAWVWLIDNPRLYHSFWLWLHSLVELCFVVVTDTLQVLVLKVFLFHSRFFLSAIIHWVADEAVGPSINMWIPPTVSLWSVQHVHLINKQTIECQIVTSYLRNILKILFLMHYGWGPNSTAFLLRWSL